MLNEKQFPQERANRSVNKVMYGDRTIIDLTEDTVVPEALKRGYTAHAKDGRIIHGELKDSDKIYNNILVPKSGWNTYTVSGDEESSLLKFGYRYRIAISISGISSKVFPNVVVNPGDCHSVDAELASVAQTYDGGLYLYARRIPITDFNILTLKCTTTV